MHHRNPVDKTIWIDAAGRELVSRLVPCRPTCDEFEMAMQYASRVRARHFRRRVFRFMQGLQRLWVAAYKGLHRQQY